MAQQPTPPTDPTAEQALVREYAESLLIAFDILIDTAAQNDLAEDYQCWLTNHTDIARKHPEIQQYWQNREDIRTRIATVNDTLRQQLASEETELSQEDVAQFNASQCHLLNRLEAEAINLMRAIIRAEGRTPPEPPAEMAILAKETDKAFDTHPTPDDTGNIDDTAILTAFGHYQEKSKQYDEQKKQYYDALHAEAFPPQRQSATLGKFLRAILIGIVVIIIIMLFITVRG